jgi:trehalose/maltose hydrolase-like predicted phosphorylase
MALAAARIGLTDESLDFFVRATRADLDSVRPDTELGVHLASYGVLWEAVVLGYAGLYPSRDGLHFRPQIPRQWRDLSFALTWCGCRIKVEVSHDTVRITTDAGNPRDVPVSVLDGEQHRLEPGREYEFDLGA